jgi:ribosomal protein S12 methylthiotransferase accessory factor
LTGLDRLGVEVASAIRPRGHVLQVSQGKGATFQLAVSSALGEAAELHAAEHPDFARFSFRQHESVMRPFVEGKTLGGEAVWVPAEAVWCPPIARGWSAPHLEPWNSNGLSSHPRRQRAIEHAVCELIERDAVARALPDGWTPRAVNRLQIPLPQRWQWLDALEFDVLILSLPALVPTAAALLVDRQESSVKVTAGYASRLQGSAAIDAAIGEAAQSRLTDIHGAREDIVRQADADAHHLLKRRSPRPSLAFDLGRVGFDEVIGVLRNDVVMVELAKSPLWVLKAWSRNLKRSELL